MFNGKKLLMAVGMAMAVVLGGSAVQAAPTDAAKEQFRQETLSLVDCDQGQLLMSMDADVKSMIHCHYESKLYFAAKPQLAGKGTVKVTMAVPNQPVSSIERDYYLQEKDEQLVAYFQTPDSSWVKSAVAMPAAQKKLYMESNKELVQASLETVKAVELGQANGDKQSYMVTVDGEKILPYFAKVMSMAGEDGNNMLPLLKPVLENIGDFTYTIEIDRAKHMVTGMQANLTEPLRRMALASMEQAKSTPEQVAKAKELISTSTMNLAIKAVPMDKVPDLKVPKKVEREAKAVKVERINGQQAAPKTADSK
ncbi:MAG: hypothetical protein PUB49_02030 [Selenomonadaceae bacterium]|nr:hypothetical protein [Selenomonadaceae bacterium]